MAEGVAGHYALHVLSAIDVKWDPKLHSKVPDLYVLVESGRISRRTQTIKNTLSPTWNEPLTFSALETSAVLHVRLYHKSHWLSDPCIGHLDITVADLLSKCSDGEAQLYLRAPAGKHQRRSPMTTGTIHLRLEAINTTEIASTELKTAKQDVQRLTSSHSAGYVVSSAGSILDDAAQMSDDAGLSKSLEDLLSKLDIIVKCIDALSEIHPYLSVAWNVASALYKSVSNQIKVDAKLVELVRAMAEAFAFLQDVQSLPDRIQKLEKSINDLLKQITECCYFVRQYTTPGLIGRMLDLNASQKIDEFKDSLVQLRNALNSGIGLHTAFVSSRISDKVDAIYLQSRLNPVETDAFSRPQCLHGTRVKIRTEITEIMSSESDQNVLWLHGVAGSGKSTVSTTVAEYFRSISRLGAFLFFERGKSEPSAVIRTLAYKLASFDSSIGKHVIAAFEKDNDIARASAATQFKRLIMEPLTGAASAIQGPVFIILDSLDECGTSESRRDLMHLLSQEFPKLPSNFRFLITSRPEADIMHALAPSQSNIKALDLDYTSGASRSDVLAYLHYEMKRIMNSIPEVRIPTDWWDSNMALLSEIAGGLFIWASTFVKLVSSSDNPFRKLKDLILESQSRSSFGLEELYASVLRNSGIVWDDGESRSRFSKVLSLLLFSKIPLSSSLLDHILGFPPDEPSQLILSKLRCLLSYIPGNPVSLFHASFSDYLISPDRVSEPWFIDIEAEKYYIVSRCFTMLEDMLHFNICDLETSFVRNEDIPDLGARIKDCIPPHLEYACVYWAQHLCDVPYSHELSGCLSMFTRRHLLFWFEVLSLLRVFGRVAGQALLAAEAWTQSNADFSAFIKDAASLASAFTFPIVESTPHIYVSMLPLMRHDSIVAEHYSKQMSLAVQVTRIGTKAPPQWLRVFEGHTDAVCSVVFTLDGKRIISSSDDHTVRVSDVETGELVAGPFEERSEVCSVALSSDGKNIVLGLWDSTLKILDTESGETISEPFEGHTEGVWSVVLSPDDTQIASGSADKTVRVWDRESGKAIGKPFEGHTGVVYSVAYSLDGTRLVSGSADHTVRVWGIEGHICISGPLEGHMNGVRSVCFSPDGKLVISGSNDWTIRIWDLGSPEVICRTIEGHTNLVLCVGFSPDGTRIISGSADRTVRLWDTASGKPIGGPLQGHTSSVNSVAFSSDGARIVSGSRDKTLMLWDVNAVNVEPGLSKGGNINLYSLAVSTDGAHIATGCSDSTIRIWELDGKLALSPLVGHTGSVTDVAFSPDGMLVASGSRDRTIRTWAPYEGLSSLTTFEGHALAVCCVTFSPDGNRIASGSSDKTIIIWDVVNGKPVNGPLKRHEDSVMSVAFSSDGSRLVSGSKDRTVIVWNPENGEVIWGPLEEHTDWIYSVVFSPDSKYIVSSSGDNSILVWNAENGNLLFRISKAHSLFIASVNFSPCGKYIVSGSEDETISIWDMSGDLVLGPFNGHAGGAESVAFSPNGCYIIAGSWDHTIRVWDMRKYLSSEPNEEKHGDVSTTSIPNEGIVDWTLTGNGWVEGKRGQRLLWVPPDLRASLWNPLNTAIFGCAFSTKLDFSDAALGERWQDCFRIV